MLSDEKLTELRSKYGLLPLMDLLRAVAEAAVRAEREGAEPVAWCTRGFADTFEYAGSLEEAQRNRACYEQWCDSPDMSVPLQQQPEPLYLHPPQASATVPEGMVMVPVEPTEEMLESARVATESEGLTTTTWLRNCVYRAMLAASQQDADKAQGVG